VHVRRGWGPVKSKTELKAKQTKKREQIKKFKKKRNLRQNAINTK
jgi:hypothetical protein